MAPEAPPPSPEETPAAAGTEEHRYPCGECGADMRFDPAAGLLTCDHCGNKRAMEGGYDGPAIPELDFKAALEEKLPQAEMEETRVLTCTSCGAQVEFDQNVHSKECPFCATPVVTDTGTHRHIKPGGLLPFKLDEDAARTAMTDWLGKLWFAPGGLQEYARKGRRMQGIYVPYWTYDADTKSRYDGERGTAYYVDRKVTRDGKTETVREKKIKWAKKSGRVSRFFDDVLVLASKTLPKRYTDNLQPWDLSEMQPYSPDFLAGFRAEGYQVPLQDGFDEARAHMDRVIQRDVRFDIGGDEQKIHRIDTQVGNVTFKHVLLPVWLAAYKYQGETYRFVVNGRTGRVQGERPWSKIKIAIAAAVAIVVVAGIGYLIANAQ